MLLFSRARKRRETRLGAWKALFADGMFQFWLMAFALGTAVLATVFGVYLL